MLRRLSTSTGLQVHNHIIPLLDSVTTEMGPVVVLPCGVPLSEDGLKFRGHDIVRLGRQFIEGLAYLHQQRIAHLDLKPSNIVYECSTKNIWIIDLDCAVWCDGVEELVTTARGTIGWAAPEVNLDDSDSNPPTGTSSAHADAGSTPYSPIRADLWSAGKVLAFLHTEKADASAVEKGSDRDSEMMQLSRLLMNENPARRPVLHWLIQEPREWTWRGVTDDFCASARDGSVVK